MGEGDVPGGIGEAVGDVPGGDDEEEGATVPGEEADADGPPDCAAGSDGEVGAAWDGEAAADGDPTGAPLGDAVSAIDDGDVVAWPPAGPRATGRGCAASTAAPSATSPSTARIGTSAIRLPSGRSSRQLGQKPETGIVT